MLTSLGGVEQHFAQGANLLFFIPTCLIAIYINWKNKNIKTKTAIIVSSFGIIGALIGGYISTKLEVNTLRKCFGVFLIFIAIFEIYSLIKLYIKKKRADNKNG